MKTLIFALLLSTSSFANDSCGSFFDNSRTTTPKRNLVMKVEGLSDRLFQAFHSAKTVTDGLNKRNQAQAPEFRVPLEQTLYSLQKNLHYIQNERNDVGFYYARLTFSEYSKIINTIQKQIAENTRLLSEQIFPYKETVFFAYRTSLIFIYMKTSDLKRIDPDALADIPMVKFEEFIENSKTYDDALKYSKRVQNEITENFLMLDYVLNDPISNFYLMTGLPAPRTVNQVTASGSLFMTFNDNLSNVHAQRNYPPFFTTYHDVVHAYTVSTNRYKVFKELNIQKPKIFEYLIVRNETKDFLEKLYKFESQVPREHQDMFHALYDSFTHDFVENLYHHPKRLTKIVNNEKEYQAFRQRMIDRAILIYQENNRRNVASAEYKQMVKVFDAFMLTNKNLIR